MEKSKTLNQKETNRRITKAAREIFYAMFNLTATRELLRIANLPMKDFVKQAASAKLPDLIKVILIRQISKTKWGTKKRYTAKELDAFLTEQKARALAEISILRKTFKNMQAQLPRKGGPGRGQALTDAQKREAIEQVSIHQKMGNIKKLPDIFEAVANTFRLKGTKVSGRTIKRAWEDRETLYAS